MTRYRCTRCKYIYDPGRGDPEAGIAQGTPFSALPESWHCPISGAPKGEFVLESEKTSSASRAGQPETSKKPQAPGKPQAPEAGEPGNRGERVDLANQPSAAAVVAAVPRPVPQYDWTVGSLKQKR